MRIKEIDQQLKKLLIVKQIILFGTRPYEIYRE